MGFHERWYGRCDDVSASHVYEDTGTYVATLRVRDAEGNQDSDTVKISPGNTPPVATIHRPLTDRTWKVGGEISFSGSAMDEQEGTLAPSALSWSLINASLLFGGDCHEHKVRDFSGVDGGSFTAPDHEYPAYLELRLAATDQEGLTGAQSLRLNPKTVKLRFVSQPQGAGIVVGSNRARAPFSRTVIVGSTNSLSASYRWEGEWYVFRRWSVHSRSNPQHRCACHRDHVPGDLRGEWTVTAAGSDAGRRML